MKELAICLALIFISLRIPGCIITHHQNVLVSCATALQRAYIVHYNPGKWDINNRHTDEWGPITLFAWCSELAIWTKFTVLDCVCILLWLIALLRPNVMM